MFQQKLCYWNKGKARKGGREIEDPPVQLEWDENENEEKGERKKGEGERRKVQGEVDEWGGGKGRERGGGKEEGRARRGMQKPSGKGNVLRRVSEALAAQLGKNRG